MKLETILKLNNQVVTEEEVTKIIESPCCRWFGRIDDTEIYPTVICYMIILENDRIKVYVVDVINKEKNGPIVRVSRKSQELVKKLFEEEVTEIFNKIVKNTRHNSNYRYKFFFRFYY